MGVGEKWLFKYEEGKRFEELPQRRQNWLLQTGARYVWIKEDVKRAREHLYNNLKLNGIDCKKIVLNNLNHSISRFFKAFNLNNRILKLMN